MSKYPNLKGLLICAIAYFTIEFSSYSSINIFSKVIKDKGYGNLGFYGIAVLYLVFSFGNFLAPSVAG